MKKAYRALYVLAALSGCGPTLLPPTPYQSAKVDGYGYVERAAASGTYELQVRGNESTSPELLESYFARRATELCPTGIANQSAKRSDVTVISDQTFAVFYVLPEKRRTEPLITGTVTCN